MAYEEALRNITLPAAGDLSSDQYKLVAVDSNGRAAVVGSAGAHADGVLTNDPSAQDRAASVAPTKSGAIVQVLVGTGGATAGSRAAATASGAATDAASGDAEVGTFVEGGSDGEVVSMLLN